MMVSWQDIPAENTVTTSNLEVIEVGLNDAMNERSNLRLPLLILFYSLSPRCLISLIMSTTYLINIYGEHCHACRKSNLFYFVNRF